MLSNYTRKAILDHLFGLATYEPPEHYYAGLSSTLPAGDGTNVTEPVGDGYTRVQIGGGGSGDPDPWSYLLDGDVTKYLIADELEWGPSTDSWVNGDPLLYIPVFDAGTDGNLILTITLLEPRVVSQSGVRPTVGPGDAYYAQRTAVLS